MSENARIGESARYFVANQPMRYGIEIVYSLEVEHCMYLAPYFTEYKYPCKEDTKKVTKEVSQSYGVIVNQCIIHNL